MRISDWSSDVCSSDLVVALKPSATPVKIDEGGELILQKIAGLDGTSTDTGLPDTIAPLWSADGKTIYFLKRTGGWTQIWRASADGTGSAPLTHEGWNVGDFAWSADGKRILYFGMRFSPEQQAPMAGAALRGFLYYPAFVPLPAQRRGGGLAD